MIYTCQRLNLGGNSPHKHGTGMWGSDNTDYCLELAIDTLLRLVTELSLMWMEGRKEMFY